jgi:hypothetical protein
VSVLPPPRFPPTPQYVACPRQDDGGVLVGEREDLRCHGVHRGLPAGPGAVVGKERYSGQMAEAFRIRLLTGSGQIRKWKASGGRLDCSFLSTCPGRSKQMQWPGWTTPSAVLLKRQWGSQAAASRICRDPSRGSGCQREPKDPDIQGGTCKCPRPGSAASQAEGRLAVPLVGAPRYEKATVIMQPGTVDLVGLGS